MNETHKTEEGVEGEPRPERPATPEHPANPANPANPADGNPHPGAAPLDGGNPPPQPAAEVFQLQSPVAPSAPRTAAGKPDPRAGKKAAPDDGSQSPFSVAIGQVYDGPFDLLLDLIRKQNIDVHDIPIARITSQFLDYTRHLQAVDVDAAGDFVYTAALLIHIKSRTLLPREPGAARALLETDDPRRELVERLLEHERFKAAAQMLEQKRQIEEATWTKPGLKRFLNEDDSHGILGDERAIAADTDDLVRIFRDILQRLHERPVHRIDEEAVTVREMIDFLHRRLLTENKPVALRRLLGRAQSERGLICTFLAMLELVRLGAILLRQPESFGDILVKKTDVFEQVLENDAQVRDDWD